MNYPTIKISEITIPDRIRKNETDISSLALSISERGLLQPIGLDAQRNLIWGYRRLTACKSLGWTEIPFIEKEIPEDERLEMEFEENHQREDFTWQDESLGILRVFRAKHLRGALEGWDWGHRQAADLMGVSRATMDYILIVAKRLEAELSLPEDKRKYWNYQSVNEAYRLGYIGEQEDEANKILAERAKQTAISSSPLPSARKICEEVTRVEEGIDALAEVKAKYQANLHNTIPFDEYWAEKQRIAEETKNTIHITPHFTKGDCITYMEANVNVFDHIITDPPYAIDMENLNQQNVNGGLKDLDKLMERHQVDENLDLLSRFWSAAFKCTKDGAFVCVFCDPMLWQKLYDDATNTGFVVQRWPMIWPKTTAMNQCAGYNATKDYELVLIARKQGATLAKKKNTSLLTRISASEVTKVTGHPFAKPFEVIAELIEMISTEGQYILDPFAGGGSIVIQLARMNRRFHGCEWEEHWFNSLLENIKTKHYLTINPKYKFV